MKGKQRVLAIVITVISVLALIGAAVLGYGYGGFSTSQSTTQGTSGNSDYQSLKKQVVSLEEQAKKTPGDLKVQGDLANAFYDLGVADQQNNPDESKNDFNQAIKAYQNVLKYQKDINMLVDLATAAFYAGQDDLAEQSFKQALVEKPDFFNALYNYGIFLSHSKNDYQGAINLWQTALNKNPNAPEAEQLKQLITQMQSMQASASSASTGTPYLSPSSSEPIIITGSGWTAVEQIIYQRCITCHGPGGKVSDKSLKTYTDVIKYVKTGDTSSQLLTKSKDGHATGLAANELGIIEEWIKSGAKEN